jgi:XRE family transcriptional regulator, fatty acid utilization regulator
MSDKKIFAGGAIRRFRRNLGITQSAMADTLAISPSYLNLIERNQRPLSAQIVLRLVERHDFDPRLLRASMPGGGEANLQRRLSDPLFAAIDMTGDDMAQWISAAPGSAAAFARLYDHYVSNDEGQGAARSELSGVSTASLDPFAEVRTEIERWRNHFADLDAIAEAVAEEIRLGHADILSGVLDRLRNKHQLSVRILPADVAAGWMVRLDLHARQLQLSELLDQPARHFAAARQLGAFEARREIDALVDGAELSSEPARALFRRHLSHYFAAAVVMPYARFLRAAEATGYDFALLMRRFSVSFEQLAHRLTTLHRIGARGLPFCMLRFDRAGQISKRHAGASQSPLADMHLPCPKWRAWDSLIGQNAFAVDHVTLDDKATWFTLAHRVNTHGLTMEQGGAVHCIVLGIAAEMAGALKAPLTHDAMAHSANPIGPGCARCLRPQCSMRARPPEGRAIHVDAEFAATAPYRFADPMQFA